MHRRFVPREHRFSYRIFMFAIDLDEAATLAQRLRWFSLGGGTAYSFRSSDYLPTGEPLHNGSLHESASANHRIERLSSQARANSPQALKARVVEHLAEKGIDLEGGRVMLITLPRVFGYLFNPVSFYFCYDRSGAPIASIAEVTNTFREMKPFVLGPQTRGILSTATPQDSNTAFRLRTPKYFYVSPFSDMDVDFDFTLRVPNGRLSVQIDDYENGQRLLTSALTGARAELNDSNLAWFTLKYPFITLRIIALIHWHAFRLWLKKVPWFAKAARSEAQRDLYRPHGSIARPSPHQRDIQLSTATTHEL